MLSEFDNLIQLLRSETIIDDSTSPISKQFDGTKHPKLPDSNSIELGEVALNVAKGYEVIAIKNNEGEIVYLPFNVAIRLLEAENTLDSLKEYSISSIEELSAYTISLYNDVEDFKNEVNQKFNVQLNLLYNLSANTDSTFDTVFDKIDNLSAETQIVLSTSKQYTDDRINELSASTDSKIDNINSNISELNSNLQNVSGDLETQINIVSGETVNLIYNLSANTDSTFDTVFDKINSISGDTKDFLSAATKYTDERVNELSASTDNKIGELSNKLSGDIETINTEIDNINDSILGLGDDLLILNDKIDNVSGGLETQINIVSGETTELIYELSANTDSTFDDVYDKINSISGDTKDFLSAATKYTDERVNELSAETDIKIEVINNILSGLSGDIESTSGDLSNKIEIVSGKTDELSDELSALTENFDSFSAETQSGLEFLSGTVSSYTDIRQAFIDVELVHAGAFKAFRLATGVDENVQYTPQKEELDGLNMTEAIDYVVDYTDELNHETERIVSAVTDNEVIHAAAFARMNTSLGFNVNGEYTPATERFSGETVTYAIDQLANDVDDINFYMSTTDPNSRMIFVTYEYLGKLIRDKKLRRGFLYRIQNYQATINSSYINQCKTRKPVRPTGNFTHMGFDIIIMATSESTLSEDALAIAPISGEGRYYFEDSPLESWKLKYCYYNDKSRFDWANDDGFGVIYYMEDEYGNSAYYDFKNIKNIFRENDTNNEYFTFDGWYATENGIAHIDVSKYGYASGNKISCRFNDNGVFKLNRVSFSCKYLDDERIFGNVVSPSINDKQYEGDNRYKIFGYTLITE